MNVDYTFCEKYYLYLVLNVCHGSSSHQYSGNFKCFIAMATSFNQSSLTSLVDENYLYKLNINVIVTVISFTQICFITIVEGNDLYKSDSTETIQNWRGLYKIIANDSSQYLFQNLP